MTGRSAKRESVERQELSSVCTPVAAVKRGAAVARGSPDLAP